MYSVDLTKTALADLAKLKKYEPNSFKKASKLLKEIALDPRQGTGQIERLKHCKEETWSRRINKEHRITYRIIKVGAALVTVPSEVVAPCEVVLIMSAYGHYIDI